MTVFSLATNFLICLFLLEYLNTKYILVNINERNIGKLRNANNMGFASSVVTSFRAGTVGFEKGENKDPRIQGPNSKKKITLDEGKLANRA